MGIFGTRVHETTITEKGVETNDYVRFGKGQDADGRTTGGANWQETDRGAHVTLFDAVHGTRITYDIDRNGNYIKHETAQNENRAHDRRHAEGAYRMASDQERRISSSGEFAEKGDYYKNSDGNWRRK